MINGNRRLLFQQTCPSMYISICMQQFQYIYIYVRKTELMENGNFRLFAANGKRKRQTSVYFLHVVYLGRQTMTVNDVCCFSIRAPMLKRRELLKVFIIFHTTSTSNQYKQKCCASEKMDGNLYVFANSH
jgi:hypothetical protein